MARVLAISSQVIYGPVGNSAAVPALLAGGHEVMQVPTVLLSHPPGHGTPKGQAIPAELIGEMLASVETAGGLAKIDAVITGYFANTAQINTVADLIERRRPRFVLVDPVIGDHGKLYVAEETATAIRHRLIPLATIATPNAFELEWLTRTPVASRDSASKAARKLGPTEVIATSVARADHLETLLVTEDDVQTHTAKRLAHVPHGTGDFLSGLYLAHRLKTDAAEAFQLAMRALDKAIARSAGSSVLDITP